MAKYDFQGAPTAAALTVDGTTEVSVADTEVGLFTFKNSNSQTVDRSAATVQNKTGGVVYYAINADTCTQQTSDGAIEDGATLPISVVCNRIAVLNSSGGDLHYNDSSKNFWVEAWH